MTSLLYTSLYCLHRKSAGSLPVRLVRVLPADLLPPIAGLWKYEDPVDHLDCLARGVQKRAYELLTTQPGFISQSVGKVS